MKGARHNPNRSTLGLRIGVGKSRIVLTPIATTQIHKRNILLIGNGISPNGRWMVGQRSEYKWRRSFGKKV
jgi:hypothetical protein